jgi:serine protease Do
MWTLARRNNMRPALQRDRKRRNSIYLGLGFAFAFLAGISLAAATSKPFWKESTERMVSHTPLPSFAPLAEKVNPAVVTVYTTRTIKSPFFRNAPDEFFWFFGPPRDFKQQGAGSGFILTEDGYIVTNRHVVAKVEEIKVAVGVDKKKEYEAKLVGEDPETDIALLKIDAEHLETVVIGDSDQLQVGDWVAAIGSPFNFPHTLTVGVVSAKGRRLGVGNYDDFIQTDASINPGNSGGPLINLAGEVVGINTLIVSPGMGQGNVGLGFAIPINLAKMILPQLKEEGKVTRSWIGVIIQEVSPELAESFGMKEAKGALVAEVVKDGPAEEAGIEPGDIILEFDGHEITDSNDLPPIVASAGAGKKVEVKILREGKVITRKIKLGEMPGREELARRSSTGMAPQNILGLSVKDLSGSEAERLGYQGLAGVLVIAVDPDSPAAGKIEPHDLIQKINNRVIRNTEEFNNAVSSLRKDKLVRLYVRRGNASMFFAFRPR